MVNSNDEKRTCKFGFRIQIFSSGNYHEKVALEIFRKLNVGWKNCISEPPNIFVWKDIDVSFSDSEKRDMNRWMEELTISYQRCNKIRDMNWWY